MCASSKSHRNVVWCSQRPRVMACRADGKQPQLRGRTGLLDFRTVGVCNAAVAIVSRPHLRIAAKLALPEAVICKRRGCALVVLLDIVPATQRVAVNSPPSLVKQILQHTIFSQSKVAVSAKGVAVQSLCVLHQRPWVCLYLQQQACGQLTRA